MSNPEIEYFKRFSACYLMWSHSNFDRIVSDAVKRQERVKAEEDEAKRVDAYNNSLMGKLFKITKEQANEYANEIMKDNVFMKGAQWEELASNRVKIGSTLKIRRFADLKPAAPLSFWKKLLTGTRKLFRS